MSLLDFESMWSYCTLHDIQEGAIKPRSHLENMIMKVQNNYKHYNQFRSQIANSNWKHKSSRFINN